MARARPSYGRYDGANTNSTIDFSPSGLGELSQGAGPPAPEVKDIKFVAKKFTVGAHQHPSGGFYPDIFKTNDVHTLKGSADLKGGSAKTTSTSAPPS